MAFPLIFIFVAYLLLAAVVGLFSLFNLYHLVRYSSPTPAMLLVSIGYLVGLGLILTVSLALLAPVDWSGNVDLLQTPTPWQESGN